MSIWRRAVEVARSNLSDIASRATSIGTRRPLEEMSDAELEAELERRRAEHRQRAAAARAGADAPDEATASRRAPPAARPSPESSALFDGLSPQRRREVRQYYANLELPFGVSLDEVKQAYRRMMRQYHPDKHTDPARKQLATQLSQKLTVAYNELSKLHRAGAGSK